MDKNLLNFANAETDVQNGLAAAHYDIFSTILNADGSKNELVANAKKILERLGLDPEGLDAIGQPDIRKITAWFVGYFSGDYRALPKGITMDSIGKTAIHFYNAVQNGVSGFSAGMSDSLDVLSSTNGKSRFADTVIRPVKDILTSVLAKKYKAAGTETERRPRDMGGNDIVGGREQYFDREYPEINNVIWYIYGYFCYAHGFNNAMAIVNDVNKASGGQVKNPIHGFDESKQVELLDDLVPGAKLAPYRFRKLFMFVSGLHFVDVFKDIDAQESGVIEAMTGPILKKILGVFAKVCNDNGVTLSDDTTEYSMDYDVDGEQGEDGQAVSTQNPSGTAETIDKYIVAISNVDDFNTVHTIYDSIRKGMGHALRNVIDESIVNNIVTAICGTGNYSSGLQSESAYTTRRLGGSKIIQADARIMSEDIKIDSIDPPQASVDGQVVGLAKGRANNGTTIYNCNAMVFGHYAFDKGRSLIEINGLIPFTYVLKNEETGKTMRQVDASSSFQKVDDLEADIAKASSLGSGDSFIPEKTARALRSNGFRSDLSPEEYTKNINANISSAAAKYVETHASKYANANPELLTSSYTGILKKAVDDVLPYMQKVDAAGTNLVNAIGTLDANFTNTKFNLFRQYFDIKYGGDSLPVALMKGKRDAQRITVDELSQLRLSQIAKFTKDHLGMVLGENSEWAEMINLSNELTSRWFSPNSAFVGFRKAVGAAILSNMRANDTMDTATGIKNISQDPKNSFNHEVIKASLDILVNNTNATLNPQKATIQSLMNKVAGAKDLISNITNLVNSINGMLQPQSGNFEVTPENVETILSLAGYVGGNESYYRKFIELSNRMCDIVVRSITNIKDANGNPMTEQDGRLSTEPGSIGQIIDSVNAYYDSLIDLVGGIAPDGYGIKTKLAEVSSVLIGDNPVIYTKDYEPSPRTVRQFTNTLLQAQKVLTEKIYRQAKDMSVSAADLFNMAINSDDGTALSDDTEAKPEMLNIDEIDQDSLAELSTPPETVSHIDGIGVEIIKRLAKEYPELNEVLDNALTLVAESDSLKDELGKGYDVSKYSTADVALTEITSNVIRDAILKVLPAFGISDADEKREVLTNRIGDIEKYLNDYRKPYTDGTMNSPEMMTLIDRMIGGVTSIKNVVDNASSFTTDVLLGTVNALVASPAQIGHTFIDRKRNHKGFENDLISGAFGKHYSESEPRKSAVYFNDHKDDTHAPVLSHRDISKGNGDDDIVDAFARIMIAPKSAGMFAGIDGSAIAATPESKYDIGLLLNGITDHIKSYPVLLKRAAKTGTLFNRNEQIDAALDDDTMSSSEHNIDRAGSIGKDGAWYPRVSTNDRVNINHNDNSVLSNKVKNYSNGKRFVTNLTTGACDNTVYLAVVNDIIDDERDNDCSGNYPSLAVTIESLLGSGSHETYKKNLKYTPAVPNYVETPNGTRLALPGMRSFVSSRGKIEYIPDNNSKYGIANLFAACGISDKLESLGEIDDKYITSNEGVREFAKLVREHIAQHFADWALNNWGAGNVNGYDKLSRQIDRNAGNENSIYSSREKFGEIISTELKKDCDDLSIPLSEIIIAFNPDIEDIALDAVQSTVMNTTVGREGSHIDGGSIDNTSETNLAVSINEIIKDTSMRECLRGIKKSRGEDYKMGEIVDEAMNAFEDSDVREAYVKHDKRYEEIFNTLAKIRKIYNYSADNSSSRQFVKQVILDPDAKSYHNLDMNGKMDFLTENPNYISTIHGNPSINRGMNVGDENVKRILDKYIIPLSRELAENGITGDDNAKYIIQTAFKYSRSSSTERDEYFSDHEYNDIRNRFATAFDNIMRELKITKPAFLSGDTAEYKNGLLGKYLTMTPGINEPSRPWKLTKGPDGEYVPGRGDNDTKNTTFSNLYHLPGLLGDARQAENTSARIQTLVNDPYVRGLLKLGILTSAGNSNSERSIAGDGSTGHFNLVQPANVDKSTGKISSGNISLTPEELIGIPRSKINAADKAGLDQPAYSMLDTCKKLQFGTDSDGKPMNGVPDEVTRYLMTYVYDSYDKRDSNSRYGYLAGLFEDNSIAYAGPGQYIVRGENRAYSANDIIRKFVKSSKSGKVDGHVAAYKDFLMKNPKSGTPLLSVERSGDYNYKTIESENDPGTEQFRAFTVDHPITAEKLDECIKQCIDLQGPKPDAMTPYLFMYLVAGKYPAIGDQFTKPSEDQIIYYDGEYRFASQKTKSEYSMSAVELADLYRHNGFKTVTISDMTHDHTSATYDLTCHTCNGTGEVEGNECPDCHGYGQLFKCTSCHGVGVITRGGKSNICPDCDGTGTVARTAPVAEPAPEVKPAPVAEPAKPAPKPVQVPKARPTPVAKPEPAPKPVAPAPKPAVKPAKPRVRKKESPQVELPLGYDLPDTGFVYEAPADED